MGAVVNDVPVARQSRDPARPQAGESLLEHQKYSPCQRQGGIFLILYKQGFDGSGSE